jgi:hypothetical protein
MAPIHHHFEKIGWSESKVVIRFWIVACIFALLGGFFAPWGDHRSSGCWRTLLAPCLTWCSELCSPPPLPPALLLVLLSVAVSTFGRTSTFAGLLFSRLDLYPAGSRALVFWGFLRLYQPLTTFTGRYHSSSPRGWRA